MNEEEVSGGGCHESEQPKAKRRETLYVGVSHHPELLASNLSLKTLRTENADLLENAVKVTVTFEVDEMVMAEVVFSDGSSETYFVSFEEVPSRHGLR